MTFDEWIRIGMDEGWCGPPCCEVHDGTPTSEAEDVAFETGDPCIHIVRLYEDGDMMRAVEANHSPSVWRRTNMDVPVENRAPRVRR